ncbi:MAG TPA: hypothetical protein VJC18_01360 [bacterium]|nr:hypothetical protein [bacterium]
MKIALPKISLKADRIKALTKTFMQDKYAKVLHDLTELEIESPDDMRVKQKIGEILYRQGKYDSAITKFDEMVRFFEKNEFILKSIRACKMILKIRPQLIDYNIKLGSLFLKLGMTNESANQYRIVMSHYAAIKDHVNTLKYAKILVKVDPSNDSKVKLAEIYHNSSLVAEAVNLYQELANDARSKKDFDKLQHYYELLLPHVPNNSNLLKDVCILNLRKQKPDYVLKLLDQYQVTDNRAFADLVKKARLMREALRRQKK